MEIVIRRACEDDFDGIARALRDWWDQPGFDSELAIRERVSMVPRLWLQHFAGTSLIAEEAGELRGFLVGFVSADRRDEGYIHFVGVAPAARRAGVGKRLYERFFGVCRGAGCVRVRCVASPHNVLSVAFHTGMGFVVEPGPAMGVAGAYMPDYDGPGIGRVRFVRGV
jgi:ribosomal protein S18 acetylase RimI-like enzyme